PDLREEPAETDERARQRKALMRAKLFGEFLLGTPREEGILDRRDRSIMAGLTFELLRHTDPSDVRLAVLLPASTEAEEARRVQTVFDAVKSQTDSLKETLRSYFTDVRDVNELLHSLRQSGGDGQVTFVNATIAERRDEAYKSEPYNPEPIYESQLN